MCERRPCWGTPKEIQRLIDAGFAGRLMLDYWSRWGHAEGNIMIISPAMEGYESDHAPFVPQGRCVFLGKDSSCEIHAMKPLEGVEAFGCNRPAQKKGESGYELHGRVAFMWDNKEGRALVAAWQKKLME